MCKPEGLVPVYSRDLKDLVEMAFRGPRPIPFAIPAGPVRSRAEWYACRMGRLNAGEPPPRPTYFDTAGHPGGSITPEGSVELVRAREYYVQSLPHRCFVNAVLLDLAEDTSIPLSEREQIEAAVMAEYERQGHLLLPLSVLAPIAHDAGRPRGPAFFRFLEGARDAILSETSPLDRAIEARVAYRVAALRMGADAELNGAQVSVAEAVIDLLLIQRACLDDVRRAESERGTAPRFELIKEMDDDRMTSFEAVLASIVRPERVIAAIGPADRRRIEHFARQRTDYSKDGVFRMDWRAVPDPEPQVVVQMRTPSPAPPMTTAVAIEPNSAPGSVALTFDAIRTELAQRIVGHCDVVDRLALAILLHRQGGRLQRILLCGRPGSGKTHVARAVAEVAGCSSHVVDASAIVEAGYRGMGVDEVLSSALAAARGDLVTLERSVLVLDEIDKIRCPPDLGGVSRDKRLGQQYALLALLGGGTPVPIHEGAEQVRTEGMLILAAGAFSDAPWSGEREPTTEDLVGYGLLEELAERLTERLVLHPRTRDDYVRLLGQSVEGATGVAALFREAGYDLNVPDETLRYVACALADGRTPAGPRSGNAALVAAARGLLIGALRAGTPQGSTLVLAPDDLAL